MFTTPFDQIFTLENLQTAAFAIKSKSVGIDEERIDTYRNDPSRLEALRDELLGGRYTPKPLKRIELPKSDGTRRPIGLSAVRDKIVQKTLANALLAHFDKNFSDKSYGYRPQKGPLRAIRRVKDFINRGYRHAYKTDIDNFFETIPHDKLLALLGAKIADGRIVSLIALYLANGSFKNFDWIDHSEGVHQGDTLSPLLSNIYLDRMDKWLESRHIEFVRFADDFVLFFKKKPSLENVVPRLEAFLDEELGLKLEASKSYAASIFKEGFTFLGCRFKGLDIEVDNERLQKKIAKFYDLAKKPMPPERFVEEINASVEGLRRYYLQILTPDSTQFSYLQSAYMDALVRRFARDFSDGVFRYKKELKPIVEKLDPLLPPPDKKARKRFVENIVDGAKTMAGGKRGQKESQKIAYTKKRYATQMTHRAVLVADTYGTTLGVAKNSVTLKKRGKLVNKIPKNHCERIIVQSRGVSVSSDLIHLCAKAGIVIDFIDHAYTPFAAIHAYQSAYAKTALLQLRRRQDPAYRLSTAIHLVRAKIKNQRNYLKYLDKYHRDVQIHIARLKMLANQTKQAASVEEAMGMEGAASAIYWEALQTIVAEKIEFPGRITQGAVDPINSALNYGYAILYGEIQKALVTAGLALNISFLHALEENKPTLVFDFIEPFRTFIVDRAIVTMVNREESIKTNDAGKLDKKSRQTVAQNVLERLGNFTRHDKESKRMHTVIQDEAYAFARAIEAGEIYKPFIGRY